MQETKDGGMNIKNANHWLESLNQVLCDTKNRLVGIDTSFDEAARGVQRMFKQAQKEDRSIYWVGNGGSSAICSHLSQDVFNKLKIRSHYFNDSSLMTCMANDFGYENVYARILTLYARKGDILIAISSSGNSQNILNAVGVAKEKSMQVISLSGMRESNKLWASKSDVAFFLDSDLYGIVEVGHEAILHGIIETLWLEMSQK